MKIKDFITQCVSQVKTACDEIHVGYGDIEFEISINQYGDVCEVQDKAVATIFVPFKKGYPPLTCSPKHSLVDLDS